MLDCFHRLFTEEIMKLNDSQIKQMKNDDAKFGEKQQKKLNHGGKNKHMINYAKMRMDDILSMDTELDNLDDEYYDDTTQFNKVK
jgi:hypothetical protein